MNPKAGHAGTSRKAVTLLATAPSPVWEQTARSCICHRVSRQRHLSCSKGHSVLRGMTSLGWILPGGALYCASKALSSPGEKKKAGPLGVMAQGSQPQLEHP